MSRDVNTNFHKEFLSLFPKDLKVIFDFELNGSHHYKVNLPDGTIWVFSACASFSFHSKKWLYRVTNNFVGDNGMKYIVNLKDPKSLNAKVNLLLTAEKANKATVIQDLFAFQKNVIFEVLAFYRF